MSDHKGTVELIADLDRRKAKAIATLQAEIKRDAAALAEKRRLVKRLCGRPVDADDDDGDGGSKRRNWKSMLAQLPRDFKAQHVRQIRGMKYVRPSEIYAGITRMIERGEVVRIRRGWYRKKSSERLAVDGNATPPPQP